MLITGTSRGIGRYMASYYASQGFHVVGCSRSTAALEHENYEHYSLDISDERAVKQMFARIRSSRGRLDVLLNNAGIASMNHSLLTPLSTFRAIFETNATATFLMCRESGHMMQRARQGRIVNFTSIARPLKLEGEAVYAASKAAVESLTQVLARELGPFGITVNAVGPTPVETDLIRGVPRAKIDAVIARQALRRMGTLEDIVNVVEFFISPQSGFVTGQIIYLGGV